MFDVLWLSQILASNPDAENHNLFECRIRRAVYPQLSEVVAQPSAQFVVQHIVRNNKHQHAALLQQRKRSLIERFLQALATAALVL